MTTTTLQATQETVAARARDLTKTYGRGMGEIMKPLGITVYGCEQDEADIFNELSPRFGVVPTITSDAVSETSVISVPGNRCISVGHMSEISGQELRALKEAG